LHGLLRDLAGQAARALGPQIRLHGRSATDKVRQSPTKSAAKLAKADDDPVHPLPGTFPSTFPGTDEDDEEDDAAVAEQRRHDGFLATAALMLAAAPIGDWQTLRAPAVEELEETYAGSARGTLKLLGFDGPDTTVNQAREQFNLPPIDDPAGEELGAAIVQQMDRAAAAWARENAGELVGQLEESTRGMLAEDVARAVEERWTDADLASHLAESYAFSETRAERIAQNELAVAKRAGDRIAISESNVATGYAWVTAGDDQVEEDCRENEDASPIGLDEEFPNGDDPHVGCRCGIIPWTEPLDEEDDLEAVAKASAEEDRSHIDPEHAVPVSLPLADPITGAEIQHIAWALVRGGNAQVEERMVTVDDLVATQSIVDSERVASNEADYRDHSQEGEDLPLVVERDGLYYILSGHHHTEGAIAAGATELRVEVMSG
jgi:hypothetical protein